MDRKKFSEKLIQLRKNKVLTQQDLGAILNISPQAISKWENGDSLPDIDMIERLASFYSISIDELISNGENDDRVIGDSLSRAELNSDEEKAPNKTRKVRVAPIVISSVTLVLIIILGFVEFISTEIYHYGVYSNLYQVLFAESFTINNIVLFLGWLSFIVSCVMEFIYGFINNKKLSIVRNCFSCVAFSVFTGIAFGLVTPKDYSPQGLLIGGIIFIFLSFGYLLLTMLLDFDMKKRLSEKKDKFMEIKFYIILTSLFFTLSMIHINSNSNTMFFIIWIDLCMIITCIIQIFTFALKDINQKLAFKILNIAFISLSIVMVFLDLIAASMFANRILPIICLIISLIFELIAVKKYHLA